MNDAKAAKVISSWIWSRFEYDFPVTPGDFTQHLLKHLDEAGLQVVQKGEMNEGNQ